MYQYLPILTGYATIEAMRVGYARVSTIDQSLDLQLDALRAAGCEKIFKDIASGSRTSRPQFDEMLSYLRAGDTIVVWKVDRLGRSMLHLISTVEDLRKRGINIQSVTEGIDTSTRLGTIFYQMTGIWAEAEREYIRERTKAGLEAARSRGRNGGRPRHPIMSDPKKFAVIKSLYDRKEKTVKEIMDLFGIQDKTTFYRYINKKGGDTA
jgi:DNA invertase Pin-like site-specific DNA recombinase